MELKLPSDFVKQMQQILGDEYPEFEKQLHAKSPISVRVNPNKTISQFNPLEPVKWAQKAFYLPERPVFTLDPLFHAGAYYVQEASSMVLEYVFLNLFPEKNDLKILDLCAAPGGKSTLLASHLPESSVLVANEVIKSRVGVLEENLTKWGVSNVIITNNDSADFAKVGEIFDFIVVDAPCSGEGLFRKDPKAVNEWSIENVEICSLRQQRIVDNAIQCLKKDRFLFYSTCTYNAKEDEQNVQYLLQNSDFELVDFDFPKDWGIKSGTVGYHFYPHLAKGEGFYFAVLKKKNSEKKVSIQPYKKTKTPKDWEPILAKHFSQFSGFETDSFGEKLTILPTYTAQLAHYLKKFLYLKKAGITIGELKGKEWIPSHEIALAIYKLDNIKYNELTKEDALKYLKKDTNLNYEFEGNGFQLVGYENIPLGWVKVIGNRINNYYPKEWRILMDL
jgi:16S rRNA C967 or C1407 C5-methylase (RsmB/RsmF family)/NOL1/NOP2/fmu family ribosome biogenesis protein